ncbi:hypothetical protein AB0M95_20885 [Sphaerisporangium sp. NPDC051017]|uniref:hypothetical protein n=1 Tax=Sphaerisporangium sp. NPDC051017 TaxID=3154636 RepID=UPI00343A6B26
MPSRFSRSWPWILPGFVVIALCAGVLTIFKVPAATGLPSKEGANRYLLFAPPLPKVLDLASGATLGHIPSPDGSLIEYTALAREKSSGGYLAATVVRHGAAEPRPGPRGAVSSIHRLTMDDKGVVEVQGAISAGMEGVIRSIAVSPAGEIAYARTTADEDDKLSSFAGVLGTGREWPVQEPYRLYWSDENTLVFPFRAEPPWTLGIGPDGEKIIAGGGVLPTLDVRSGAAGTLPVPPDLTSYGMVELPDHRIIWATASRDGDEDVMSLVLYDGPTAIGTVFRATQGKIVSMTLDSTGRHLLVGHEIVRPTGTGMYDFRFDQKLVRVDLRGTSGLATPATGSRGDLALPQEVVWRGSDELVAEIAW